MKWRGRRQSGNIVDRRRGGGRAAGGIGGVGVVVVVVVAWFLGIDVTPLLQGLDEGGTAGGAQVELTEADREAGEFVAVTLADTEEIWAGIFRDQLGRSYRPAELVLFKGATRSACGGASAATGPFYCPPERRIFLDTDFFVTLERRLGARGDFAAAYVVAHEVAHHVQNEVGTLGQANQLRAGLGGAEANAVSVRIELQADCYAGIWARHAEEILGTIERGDIAEAMTAAAQIGDDTLQRNAGQVVRPHTFTHGTSEQRQSWFRRGYESGRMAACDTFGTDRL